MGTAPWNEILKYPDPNAVKEPMVQSDGNVTDGSTDTLPSLPNILPNLESNGSGTTICISSNEDLEESMLMLDTDNIISLQNDD